MAKLWHLYKIEFEGVLIYIGVTNDLVNRRSGHSARRFIPFRGGSMTVIRSFRKRPQALDAEVAAIREHMPIGNFRSNPIGYASVKDRDLAVHTKLAELERQRYIRLYPDVIEALKT